MQPLQLAEHDPLELQVCPPHWPELAQAWHTHSPELQYGVVPPQSEFRAHPTHEPWRQIGVAPPQFPLPRQPTQMFEALQYGVAPPQPAGQ